MAHDGRTPGRITVDWIGLLALGFVAGVCLGALFFGGLWWTSDRLAESAHPGRLIAGQFPRSEWS